MDILHQSNKGNVISPTSAIYFNFTSGSLFLFNTLRSRQNCYHFTNEILKFIFLHENCSCLIQLTKIYFQVSTKQKVNKNFMVQYMICLLLYIYLVYRESQFCKHIWHTTFLMPAVNVHMYIYIYIYIISYNCSVIWLWNFWYNSCG